MLFQNLSAASFCCCCYYCCWLHLPLILSSTCRLVSPLLPYLIRKPPAGFFFSFANRAACLLVWSGSVMGFWVVWGKKWRVRRLLLIDYSLTLESSYYALLANMPAQELFFINIYLYFFQSSRLVKKKVLPENSSGKLSAAFNLIVDSLRTQYCFATKPNMHTRAWTVAWQQPPQVGEDRCQSFLWTWEQRRGRKAASEDRLLPNMEKLLPV